MWLYFAAARLLPTTHVADVTKVRVVIIYTIMNGENFYVGRHIAVEIETLAT